MERINSLTAERQTDKAKEEIPYFALNLKWDFSPETFDKLARRVGCDHGELPGGRSTNLLQLEFLIADNVLYCFPKEYVLRAGIFYEALKTKVKDVKPQDAGSIILVYEDASKEKIKARYLCGYGLSLYCLDIQDSHKFRQKSTRNFLGKNFVYGPPPNFV